MKGRFLILAIFVFTLNVDAQKPKQQEGEQKSTSSSRSSDPLLKHLKAAENYQISGNLTGALIENRAVLTIALQRFGNTAIEEGKYAKAAQVLTELLKYDDSAANRTNLAIAYLRQKLFKKAIAEAQAAVLIDPNHVGSRYILSNIYYTSEDYEAALPELEYVYSKAPDFEIARALGLSYLKLKKIELARKHFREMQAVAKKPSANLHYLLAKLYERTNYPADAERELKRALEINPNLRKLNFYLGYLLLQNGGSQRLSEAGAAFERELALEPNDFFSLFFGGVVASSENDHQKAISLLSRAIKINPNSGEAHLFLGQSQIEMNDLDNAEKNLRIAVRLEANGGKNTQARRTHFMLGRLLLKTGRKEEARKELKIAGQLQQKSLNSSRSEIERILGQVAEKSELDLDDEEGIGYNPEVKLFPKRAAQLKRVKNFLVNVIAQGYNNLGVIATQNNMLGEAVDNFAAAYEWKPEFPNLSRNLGIVSFRASEFEKAIDPMESHLKKNPKDLLIRKMLGSSYYFTKNYAKSVAVLKPINTEVTNDPELAYFYCISLIQLKRNKDAAIILDALAKSAQQNPGALNYAAQGFMILSDYERAVKEFGRVLALSPETAKANYFIGQSLMRLNRLAEAEEAFSRELEINPADPLSKYHLALTLIERKIETDRAVKTLEEAVDLKYDYADALYQLGKISLEKGENQKAIERLERAVSADAGKDYIHYQLSIAYRKASRKADADRELKLYQKLKSEKRKSDNPLPMGGSEN
ncbi:MAG: tetratricopeptide repeat protein [Pyrinomonadaceae bacterium]|nr:tetratricopeptide repeat protein [Pyrinomonadaceae bacterium]